MPFQMESCELCIVYCVLCVVYCVLKPETLSNPKPALSADEGLRSHSGRSGAPRRAPGLQRRTAFCTPNPTK